MTKLYALKGPSGKLYPFTLTAHADGYQDDLEGLPWHLIRACRDHLSLTPLPDPASVIDWAVKQRGYTVVPVEVREVEP